MRAMLEPGLDVRAMISAGPLSFQQSVKYVQVVYTYAQLVGFGTTEQQIIGAVAGKWIIPISWTAEMTRTSNTAGTTVPCQLRYNGDTNSILGVNLSPLWANGGGLPLNQNYQAFMFNTSITFAGGSGVGVLGFAPRGKAIMLKPTAAHLATGCVGSVIHTFGYIESK